VKGVTVIAHPLVQHNLTRLRDRRTQPQEFRRLLGEIASLMIYEATRSFATRPISVQTPLETARGFNWNAKSSSCPCCAPASACSIPFCN
jgi:uracil phosphoribosyltransferase